MTSLACNSGLAGLLSSTLLDLPRTGKELQGKFVGQCRVISLNPKP